MARLPCKICNFNINIASKSVPESLVHMMWYCPQVQEIWREMGTWLKERFGGRDLKLDLTNIVLNKISTKRDAVNFICLIVKQYIYRQRCLKKCLNINELRNYISYTENIEKYIATKNNRLSFHDRKWGISQDRNLEEINEYVLEYLYMNNNTD